VKKKIALLLILVFAFAAAGWSEVFLNRIEASFQYDYLTPDSLYGDWNAITVTYFREVSPTFNYHVGASAHYRNKGAILLFAGIAKDWSQKLFSNFAVSTATNCDYLQRYRLDADINLKLFKSEFLIATLGYAYVKYHNVHEDIIWRYGLSAYIKRIVLEFMIFNNTSMPGDSKSSTSLFGIGYGIDGWQWTHLIFNFGQQSYLATYALGNPEVIQDSNEITLKHRHWIKKDFGWFASFGFMELGDSYNKYLFEFGLFWKY